MVRGPLTMTDVVGEQEIAGESEGLIFVSIAAYRDPQLVPTVMDCLRKARYPERVRFGICWQRDVAEGRLVLPVGEDERFRVLEMDWRESRGACWARAEVMKLWRGEDWFLQVDSHCRFAEGWDAVLVGMMGDAVTVAGNPRVILSTYATPFTPTDDPAEEDLRGGPLTMVFQAFTPEGIPQLRPGEFPVGMREKRAVRSRFVSAGFLFAAGRFVEEVPYDPELYFMGEEAAMTVRAFTHGWDFFHPAETVVWHDYLRADAKKHWGDHTEVKVARPWGELDAQSKGKVQRLLLGEAVGEFGLGTMRTLGEYEAFAGLSFRHRKAQQATVRGVEPPNAEAGADWVDRVYPWIVRVRLRRSELPEGALVDATIWNLAILDEEGFEVCRRDVTPGELAPLGEMGEELELICEFPSETVPVRWTVWPLSRSRGWLRRVGGVLLEGDFAILREEG